MTWTTAFGFVGMLGVGLALGFVLLYRNSYEDDN